MWKRIYFSRVDFDKHMTPLEIAKLFSSFTMAAFLVWLTNFAERNPEPVDPPEYDPRQHATAPPEYDPRQHATAPPLSPRQAQSGFGYDPLWNVSSFFGFKTA